MTLDFALVASNLLIRMPGEGAQEIHQCSGGHA